MSNFITIKTFSFSHEAVILKGALENEGIECYLKDEFITQVNPLYSQAVGGVKLQVREKDVPEALEIMKENGYRPDEGSHTIKLHQWLEKVKVFLGKRWLWILVAAIIAVAAGIAYILQPAPHDLLTENYWCVDYITYNDTDYRPSSSGISIGISYNDFTPAGCTEHIQFYTDGIISFPGFKTHSIKGKWDAYDNLVTISEVDTFDHVFVGDYLVDFEDNTMTLWSEKTIIYCHKARLF